MINDAYLLMYGCASEIMKKLAYEVGKLSSDVKDLRRLLERQYASSRSAEVSDADALSELVNGPIDKFDSDLLDRLGRKSTQSYMVSLYTLLVLLLQ